METRKRKRNTLQSHQTIVKNLDTELRCLKVLSWPFPPLVALAEKTQRDAPGSTPNSTNTISQLTQFSVVPHFVMLQLENINNDDNISQIIQTLQISKNSFAGLKEVNVQMKRLDNLTNYQFQAKCSGLSVIDNTCLLLQNLAFEFPASSTQIMSFVIKINFRVVLTNHKTGEQKTFILSTHEIPKLMEFVSTVPTPLAWFESTASFCFSHLRYTWLSLNTSKKHLESLEQVATAGTNLEEILKMPVDDNSHQKQNKLSSTRQTKRISDYYIPAVESSFHLLCCTLVKQHSDNKFFLSPNEIAFVSYLFSKLKRALANIVLMLNKIAFVLKYAPKSNNQMHQENITKSDEFIQTLIPLGKCFVLSDFEAGVMMAEQNTGTGVLYMNDFGRMSLGVISSSLINPSRSRLNIQPIDPSSLFDLLSLRFQCPSVKKLVCFDRKSKTFYTIKVPKLNPIKNTSNPETHKLNQLPRLPQLPQLPVLSL